MKLTTQRKNEAVLSENTDPPSARMLKSLPPHGENIPCTAIFHVLQVPINTIDLMINLLSSSVKALHRLLKMESYCVPNKQS